MSAVEAVGLSHQRDVKTTKLSGGQLRRTALASVLTLSPSVLLLDEPTAGFDPAQRLRFRQVLQLGMDASKEQATPAPRRSQGVPRSGVRRATDPWRGAGQRLSPDALAAARSGR